MKKKLIVLISAAIVMLSLFLIAGPKTKKKIPFSLEAISAQVPVWQSPPTRAAQWDEVDSALSQPYRFLAAGGQCFTFVSQDDKYAVKFFKQKAFALPSWAKRFPLPALIHNKQLKLEKKRDTVFSAFQLSFENLREETGLLYVHLTPTNGLNKQLSLTDQQGKVHTLSLDAFEFVVQRKAELAFQAIDRYMAEGNSDAAKKAIDQVLTLHFDLYKKGYRNRDPNVRSNYGFIDGKAVLIDVGRLVKNEEGEMHNDLEKIAPRFERYLKAKHPELLAYFEQLIEKEKTL